MNNGISFCWGKRKVLERARKSNVIAERSKIRTLNGTRARKKKTDLKKQVEDRTTGYKYIRSVVFG